MGLAEHLAIVGIGRASLAPSGDVVGVHLVQFVNAFGVVVAAERAVRAVGDAVRLRRPGLQIVDILFHDTVEDPNLQEILMLAAIEAESPK